MTVRTTAPLHPIAQTSAPWSTRLTLGTAALALLTSILLACGNDDGPPPFDDDDRGDFACCNRGEYFECPNPVAADQCDDSFFPDTNCDRKPKKDKYCR